MTDHRHFVTSLFTSGASKIVLTISLLTATYLLAPLGLEAIAWGYLALSCAGQVLVSIPFLLSIRQMEAQSCPAFQS